MISKFKKYEASHYLKMDKTSWDIKYKPGKKFRYLRGKRVIGWEFYAIFQPNFFMGFYEKRIFMIFFFF